MGVRNWTTFLREENWLPSDNDNGNCACIPRLWRQTPTFRGQALPTGATLHIDGNGLVYHLGQIAHAQVVAEVLGGAGKKKKKGKNLTPAQVQALIPTFLSLSKVREVTDEFVSTLKRCNYNAVVYWDGPSRPVYKAVLTEKKRRARRAEQWSALKLYCDTGHLPTPTKETCIGCACEAAFPTNPGIHLQVKHTLHVREKLPRVDCPGEADDFIARTSVAAVGNNFVLGKDSDYAFMKGVSYVPLDTMALINGNELHGTILTRKSIAESLHLPDNEDSMVEIALALGNDFVPPRKSPVKNAATAVQGWIDYIKQQDPHWRLPSTACHAEIVPGEPKVGLTAEYIATAMDFCRRWYNLGDIRESELKGSDHVTDADDELVSTTKNSSSVEPILPTRIEKEDAIAKHGSIKDAIVRVSNAFVVFDEFSEKHVACFQRLGVDRPVETASLKRPSWEDVFSATWMTKIVCFCVSTNLFSPLSCLFPPESVFDFRSYLHNIATEHSGNSKLNDDETRVREKTIKEEPVVQTPLPIDEHEERILETVKKQRVTILQGGTGCGKSSRVPVMLLRAPPPDPSLQKVKMFISQPKRIAAWSLVRRLRSVEPDLRDLIALRMGHGYKEFETPKTTAWFVTTGYLVRLLANHPERFDDVSYLIIDEVHERSVETDILCLLCRQLVERNKSIRLVLMSATLAASLYQDYFKVESPVIKVGAKRFPVKEVFLEDVPAMYSLPPKLKKTVTDLLKEQEESRCKRTPSASSMSQLYDLVSHLATVVAKTGTSVLIFVPGMNDIVQITERVENLFVAGKDFNCVPVHGDVPDEDQGKIFEPVGDNEVKVIIATNIAESSVTLPDCDHVICLGLCKHIVYNELSHRQLLTPTWISRASALQRAGRTSRVRPGTVYRMYSRDIFRKHMLEFEPGEMLRTPLDTVILTVKQIFADQAVRDVLLDCLEPPEMSTIDRSFKSLFQSHFVSSPDDDCEITSLGTFVSALGIDLSLGSLIGLGIQFGVGSEAIDLAAVLAMQKTPWVQSNPLHHEFSSFNEMTAKTYTSRCRFDDQLFSEPFSVINCVDEYEKTNSQMPWCKRLGVFRPRVKMLGQTRRNLRQKVARHLDVPLDAPEPPRSLPHAKTMLLRVLQVWVFPDSLIECANNVAKSVPRQDGRVVLTLDPKKSSKLIEENHIQQVLPTRSFSISRSLVSSHTGNFDWTGSFSFRKFLGRLLSYGCDKNLGLLQVTDPGQKRNRVSISVQSIAAATIGLDGLLEQLGVETESLRKVTLATTHGGRGRSERPCGRWQAIENEEPESSVEWLMYNSIPESVWSSLSSKLTRATESGKVSTMKCALMHNNKKTKTTTKFDITLTGPRMSDLDLTDLFAVSSDCLKVKSVEKIGKRQLVFSEEEHITRPGSPIQTNVPQALRLLGVLASERRRKHFIRFVHESPSNAREEDENYVDMYPLAAQTDLARRWTKMSSKSPVFFNANSVVMSALPLSGPSGVYAVCANTLEIKGGAVKVDGVTLLPQGKLFLLLCRLTFGLFRKENLYDGSLVEKSMLFLGPEVGDNTMTVAAKIRDAASFHEECAQMGESLECFPEKVRLLLSIFDSVNGCQMYEWDSLDEDPFVGLKRKVKSNLKKTPNGR